MNLEQIGLCHSIISANMHYRAIIPILDLNRHTLPKGYLTISQISVSHF